MKRVNFKYTATGTFTETGGFSLDLEDPNDADEINRKIKAQDFAEYLPGDRDLVADSFAVEFLP